MLGRTRSFFVALAIASLLLSQAAAAEAFRGGTSNARQHSVPVVFDVMFLRPAGLAMTLGGTALYSVIALPLAMVSRPMDALSPAKTLVVNPARYTFVDPLGHHPPK